MMKCSRKYCSESRPDQFDVKKNGKPYSRCKRHYDVEKQAKRNAKKNPNQHAKYNAKYNAKAFRLRRKKNIELMVASRDKGLDPILTKEQRQEKVALFSQSIEQTLDSNPNTCLPRAGATVKQMLAEGFASFGRKYPPAVAATREAEYSPK